MLQNPCGFHRKRMIPFRSLLLGQKQKQKTVDHKSSVLDFLRAGEWADRLVFVSSIRSTDGACRNLESWDH